MFLGAAPSQILPRGGGMGQPGFPIPLLAGCAPPHPPAGGGVGQPGCPTPLAEGVCTRQAPCAWRTTPDATGPGARASRPRHGAAGTVTAPSLTFPPLGEGTRLLPPAGGGWEGGRTLRTMVTSAVHAAPPHNAAMKISLFLRGLRPPKPSRGRGWGNPVSPCPSSRAYVHVRIIRPRPGPSAPPPATMAPSRPGASRRPPGPGRRPAAGGSRW